jgi:flagellin
MRYEDFDRLFPIFRDDFKVATDIAGVYDSGVSNRLASSHHKDGTLQSVEGTLLIHSPISGSAGKMTISGNERLLRGLGFAEVQNAVDPVYEATLSDAHSGNIVASGMKFSGNTIVGALNNIDITFETNFALTLDGKGVLPGKKGVAPDEYGYGTYKFIAASEEFIVHVASNSTVLQVGANEGESFNVAFGDAGVRALGIHKISLLNRESASRAITLLDNAMNIVSAKRARLGAYQNRLEHTTSNLTASSTNMKLSESRIRDADMAKEMMEFTKLNILSQAGNSMLAQANQMPQNILSLLRQK